MLSNELSRRYVHKMRSEESAILVGYHTARLDDPGAEQPRVDRRATNPDRA